MGLRYRKSIKLLKGIKLNLSTYGPSITIGKTPFSLNVSKRGVYATASVPDTGVSWRQKLFGGNSSSKKSSSSMKSLNPQLTKEQIAENTAIVENYERDLDITLNLHKTASNVATKEQFDAHLQQITQANQYEMLEKAINGDQQTLELLVEKYVSSLQFPYEASLNYELDGNTLYADLDLPEIEDLDTEYPILSHSKEVLIKKKTITTAKQQYSKIVLSLPIYLASGLFNLSPAIETIVLSARTQKRNKDGDEVDNYLYSVKFTRDLFEQTDLEKVDDTYGFLTKFVNRINISTGYNFKAITPYQKDDEAYTLQQAISKAEEKTPAYLKETSEALKSLGYKTAEINYIMPRLKEKEYSSTDECLKDALKILGGAL